jgi:thymidylate kinase
MIFDRFYDDILVDNRRYRYGGNIKIAKLVRAFIPKPALYFVLTADANVIHQRKKEVSYKELERQIIAYQSLTDQKRYFSIDVNRTPEAITTEIIHILMKKMHERY